MIETGRVHILKTVCLPDGSLLSTCSGYRELASSKHVFHVSVDPCCVCVNSKNTCFMYLFEEKNSGNFSNLFFCHWLVIGRILYLSYEAKIHLKIIAECEF